MSSPKTLRIGEFCKTGSGSTPSRSELAKYYDGGTIPWVKSGELREGIILEAEEHVTHAALADTSIKLVPKGAILLAMYGATVGRLALLGIEATTNQAVCHIVPDPDIADTRYLFHALSSQVPEIVAMGVGGAQPNISQGVVKNLNVWLPPLTEQRRIAAILDKADALRTKRREALLQLDRLAQSIFVEVFGAYTKNGVRWCSVPLGELADEMKIGLVRSSEEFGDAFSTPYVRMNAIGRGGEFYPELVQKTDVTEAELAEYRLKVGDLLFNTRNSKELVGKTAIFREGGDYVYNNNLMRIRFDERVDAEYVAQCFLTPFIQQELEFRKSGTTSVFAIYARDLNTLPVPVPPINLQREYAKRMQKITSFRKIMARSEEVASRMFVSLQHRAYRGEL